MQMHTIVELSHKGHARDAGGSAESVSARGVVKCSHFRDCMYKAKLPGDEANFSQLVEIIVHKSAPIVAHPPRL